MRRKGLAHNSHHRSSLGHRRAREAYSLGYHLATLNYLFTSYNHGLNFTGELPTIKGRPAAFTFISTLPYRPFRLKVKLNKSVTLVWNIENLFWVCIEKCRYVCFFYFPFMYCFE